MSEHRSDTEDDDRDLDAGREFMRQAWNEFNAIRARDGAPEGVSEEWWSSLTDNLEELLGADARPWMTGSAKLLVKPYRAEINAALERAEKAEALLAKAAEALGPFYSMGLAYSKIDAFDDNQWTRTDDSEELQVGATRQRGWSVTVGDLRRATAVCVEIVEDKQNSPGPDESEPGS